jgi:hypothetical protein
MRFVPALVAALLVSAVLAAGSALAVTFTDGTADTVALPQGADVTTVTPVDMTLVDVTNTPDGRITFRITVANQTLPPLTILGVAINHDRNGATGDEGVDSTLDLVVQQDGSIGALHQRWNGTDFVDVTPTQASGSFAAGVLTLSVPRSELGNTRSIDFEALALVFRADLMAIVADIAPDTANAYTFDLVGLPAPRLAATRPTGTPARPIAGRAFVVSTAVTNDETEQAVRSGTVTCVVRVGTARIRAAGRFVGGRARCSMTVPRTARGKTIRGTMTIRSGGAAVTAAFSFRVRP